MHFQSEVHVHSVKDVQNRGEPPSEVFKTLLQERLTDRRKSVTGMPDAGSAESVNNSREVNVRVRLGINEVSAGFSALFQVLRGALAHGFRISVTPDLR